MRGMHRLVSTAAAILLAAGLISAASGGPAYAYGHDGSMDVYQVGISFNCNNRTYCSADELGGFWGWAEFDHDPVTGANTGDAEFAGCSHGTFKGAAHTSIDITDWHIAPGSAGPMTFFVTDESTTTFRGQRETVTETDADTGVPAVQGHYSSVDIFGIKPPPGINAEITVAFKPAH